ANPSEPDRGSACFVPSGFPDLQSAIDEPSCATIFIDQAAVIGDANVNRSLAIVGRPGAGSKIFGQVSVTGGGLMVVLTDLHVDTSIPELAGCYDRALFVGGGANVRADGVRVSNRAGSGSCVVADVLFEDRFQL
ncbi:MAG: hypothetical protein AAGJ52_07920, partial [Pseudomonadota bacterium]